MKTIGHLEQFDLTLTTMGPVFVGCGKTYGKKEYVFLPGRSSRVLLPKEADFFRFLVDKNLVDKYETYMLGAERDLYTFLKMDCRLSDEQIRSVCPYQLAAEDALDANHSLKAINAFMRDAHGRVYVPGSSLKGALRTILLAEKMIGEGQNRQLPSNAGNKNGQWEEPYFHTLKLNKKRPDDAVNSIMRGILISDSEPIDDSAMMLAGKSDFSVNGMEKKINLTRECIRPNTDIHFRLTLDHSVLKHSITAESIMKAIFTFDDYYMDNYLSCFDQPKNISQDVIFNQFLILGGGAGFFSKTVTYPYCGNLGLSQVSRLMQRQFRNHKHEGDENLGISPHTMKYASYRGQVYPYGICWVEIR